MWGGGGARGAASLTVNLKNGLGVGFGDGHLISGPLVLISEIESWSTDTGIPYVTHNQLWPLPLYSSCGGDAAASDWLRGREETAGETVVGYSGIHNKSGSRLP